MSAWTSAPVSLKYRLGEVTLFERRMTMHVLPFKVIADDQAPTDLRVPDEPLADDEQAYLMRCLPLPGEQPVISSQDGFMYYIPSQFHRFYIDLRQSFDEYAAKFSSKTRSTIRRKIRKFDKHCDGAMRWESYATPEEMDDFFKYARAVSSRSYQEQLLDAGLPDGAEFRESMMDLAGQDRVRGYVLFDGERPVAYMYCPITDDVLLYLYLGYDADYVKWSVGTILHWLAFEDIFREGRFRFFDFTEGQSEHKRMYSTGGLLCGNVYVFPKSPRAWLTVHSHRLTDAFSTWLGNALDRWGLKPKVRKLIRAVATR